MAQGGSEGFGAGEQPPPSALAGRRKKYEMGEERKKKSYGLMMWSMFGSKHDEHTIQREENIIQQDERDKRKASSAKPPEPKTGDAVADRVKSSLDAEVKLFQSSTEYTSRTRSRRRTITVTDAGQTEGRESDYDKAGLQDIESGSGAIHTPDESSMTTDPSMLGPRYNPPKFKNKNLDILKDDDRASVSTGAEVESLRNASTTAVFAAPGVLRRERKATNASNLSTSLTTGHEDGNIDGMRSEVASTMRPDTPASTRSNERLQSHQEVHPGHLRSLSAIAIMRAPGVVGVVDGEGTDTASKEESEGKEIASHSTNEVQTESVSEEKINAYLEAKVQEQETDRTDGNRKGDTWNVQ
jgi:hypothetical protein